MKQNSNNFPVHDWQVKSTPLNNSGTQSSELCVYCGMCCSGIIFSHVSISDNAYKRLDNPDTIVVDGTHKMQFPCQYLDNCSCTIYGDRPKKCGSFICKLLDNLIDGDMNIEQTKKIVDLTKEQTTWLLKNLGTILNKEINYETVSLRNSLYEVYSLLSNRFKQTQNPSFTDLEYQFCLNALDFFKGMKRYFNDPSMLKKYNNLASKMSSTNELL